VIKVDEFTDHFAMLKENRSFKLKQDFQKVSVDLPLTQHAAQLICNKTKNRFINIMPCKSTVKFYFSFLGFSL